jgi:hypothetical protein
VVIVVLIGAVIATPARGVGERIVDLVWSPSAPPEVQDSFASNNESRKKLFAFAEESGGVLHDRFSAVIASQARGIFAIDAPGGPIYLWAAPTEDGRECWLIQAGVEPATKRPFGLGGCDVPEPRQALNPTSIWWDAERPDIKILSARTYDDAIVQVDVELDGAAPLNLPVIAGYALGTVPKEQHVLAFIGRDADGEEVARYTMPNG